MTLKEFKKIPLGKVRIYMKNGAKIDGFIVREEYYYILSNVGILHRNRIRNMRCYKNAWRTCCERDLNGIDKIITANSYEDVNLYNLKKYDTKRHRKNTSR